LTPPERSLRVAVVQLALEVGEVERNLRHVEEVVASAAREHDPELIVLPEALTSPIVYSDAMLGVARQVDGEPYELLRRLAREHGCWVAGGFLAVRGTDAKSTYVLAEPGGATHLHDKDQPTMWEANYATGTYDDGFASTPLGPLGMVTGAEWIRSRTALRLAGYVRLLLGGSCWWSYPTWPLTRSWLMRREHDLNVAIAREAPARMARLVGAPAAIAQQVGRVRGGTPMLPGVPYPTQLVGESQIVERDGRVLARLSASDGAGHVAADVRLAEPEPLDPLPSSFWLPVLPATMHLAWLAQGFHGRRRYRQRRRAGGFPWQEWPRHQLLPYNPPDGPPETHPERQVIAESYGVDPIPAA
jgi:predicted amidohydrolase